MHTQYFYAGIELGMSGDIVKQANVLKKTWGALKGAPQAFDQGVLNLVQKGANHPNKAVNWASRKAFRNP